MSDEHFTVDGTLIEAWANQKSFQRKDGGKDDGDGTGRNFHGQARKNATHASKTDPEARLYRKSDGAESRLAYLGHLLIENRHGLIVDARATTADDYGEREAATLMMCAQWARAPSRRRRLGADKAYDVRDFVCFLRELRTTPHVAQKYAFGEHRLEEPFTDSERPKPSPRPPTAGLVPTCTRRSARTDIGCRSLWRSKSPTV